MNQNDLRIAIELYFLGTGGEDVAEECSVILFEACVEIFGGNEEDQHKNFYEKFVVWEGKVPGEFIDDRGNKRLRLKTICEKTGIEYKHLTTIPYKDLDIRGADAIDYSYLCEKRIERGGVPFEDMKEITENFMMHVPKPGIFKRIMHKFGINK